MIDPQKRWGDRGRPDFAGLPTWSGVRYTEEPDELAGAEVVVIGAPTDDLVSDRPGARLGPRAIRAASLGPGARVGSSRDPFAELRVIDYGDAAVRPGDAAASHAAIATVVGEAVAAGAIPVTLGGDHSITGPALRACAARHGPLALLHFDAHADTAAEVFGVARSHGSVMRELLEGGAVDPVRYVQLGLRGYWPDPGTLRWQAEQGVTAITMDEIVERGVDAAIERAARIAGRGPVYLSVDVDVVDPASAPGTGTPEPGGLMPRELLRAVRELARRVRLVGIDVVEVAPLGEWPDPTALLADRVIREALVGLTERQPDAARATPAERPERTGRG